MIALRVTRRPGASEPDASALPLPPEGLLIGRADHCGLVLPDPLRLVSREHARITGEGGAVRVRCVSSTAPLWVNDQQLDPGAERVLRIGDRLRIGHFELAVEPGLAPVRQPSRLERWFDLDDAPDPLAAGSPLPAALASPLPAAVASPEPAAMGAVVSWETGPQAVRGGALQAPSPAVVQPPVRMPMQPASQADVQPSGQALAQVPTRLPARAPLQPAAANEPAVHGSAVAEPAAPRARGAPARSRATVTAAAAAVVLPEALETAPPQPTPPPRPATARRGTRRSAELSPELRELAQAFARGAGLRPEVAQLTPEWMEHLGALLRAAAEGTLALLQSRAVAKRHMRAEGTHIAPRQNNPLKFSPDATEALTRMLQREGSPGFLEPVAALRDAHRDLLVHQVAMVAGMRAAVFELFERLGPATVESAEGPAHGPARLPLVREAALWRRYRMQHAQLLEHLDDDFEAIFGREFLRAYEAQSRAVAEADPAPPEAP